MDDTGLYSLFPVLRGEGWEEGRAALHVARRSMCRLALTTNRAQWNSTRTPPLSPALSPEYREEGVREPRRRGRGSGKSTSETLDHLGEALARLEAIEELAVEDGGLLGLAELRVAKLLLPARDRRVIEL